MKIKILVICLFTAFSSCTVVKKLTDKHTLKENEKITVVKDSARHEAKQVFKRDSSVTTTRAKFDYDKETVTETEMKVINDSVKIITSKTTIKEKSKSATATREQKNILEKEQSAIDTKVSEDLKKNTMNTEKVLVKNIQKVRPAWGLWVVIILMASLVFYFVIRSKIKL